ncbi:hypothetical protein A3D77_06915 [Candidatus Gottesmanbacteria bacterium RIFCSPHIGHO2_02_FULL_39_11]|uniref:Phosphoglycerate mutase n=1 Tax=Candidatus Gottesmanbacteria bacterium RIFCSPHIGHO2_02_FULL_39_11 TaxID=1798382 RepID=A0A1F5ZJU8_9BACT|nr:MAG: hypothetical protein A3D77_06915 [Candidatus Gottesmanbacteria bacterium RIFCSPHIGHO2_02_FULL_39_11]
MKSTKLILLRHGQVHNPKSILYGRLPGFGLSAKGREDVLKAYEKLKNESIDTIFMSPLLRTRQTASIFAKNLGLAVHTDKRLIEVKLYCEGVSLTEFKSDLQPDLYSEENYKKGQESVEEISQRMNRFLSFIKEKYPGKTVLAVSHGDPIIILESQVLKTPFTWEFKRDNYVNTAYYRIIETGRHDKKWHVRI